MNPVLRVAVFLLTMTTVMVGAHYYLYSRWVRPFSNTARTRRNSFTVAGIGLLTMVGAIFLSRKLEGTEWVTPLAFLGFGYMGVLFVAMVVTAGIHAFRAIYFFVLTKAAAAEHSSIDLNRRHFLTRTAAATSMVVTTGASAKSFHQASMAPTKNQLDVRIKNLPAALEGFRLVQLSDVHIGPTLRKDFLWDVVRRVNAQKPDLVAITGDLVDGSVRQLGEHVAPLGALEATHGVYFTTGNHEYYSGADQWITYLRSLNIRVLRNECVTVTHQGAPLDILGVDDWKAKVFGGDHGHDLKKALTDHNPAHPSILLAHQPKAIFEAAEAGMDLVLSGHTHGGQIFPFNFLVQLVQPYLEGLHRHGDHTQIFVHRGTGYWGIPMRLGTEAEIVTLRLIRDLNS